jgi:hypothetical protein
VPYALAILVDHLRPVWPRRRKVVLSALPLPLLIGFASLGMVIDATTRSAQACGKDFCDMLETLGLGGLLLALIVLVLALAVANVATPKH